MSDDTAVANGAVGFNFTVFPDDRVTADTAVAADNGSVEILVSPTQRFP